jgi:SNF2 family DNA or RNA helicase
LNVTKKTLEMITLRSYQKEGVKFFAESTRRGVHGVIFDEDPGLGKTIQALTCAELLMRKGANVLYITRKTLDIQVIDEAIRMGMKPLKFKGNTTQIFEQIKSVPKRTGTLVVVKNGAFRSRSNLKNKQLWKDLGDPYDLIIIDECHDYKNPNSIQTGSLCELAKNVPHRIPMTGTLIGNSELDVFVPCMLADPLIFGTSFYRFRSTYFNGFKAGGFVKYTLKKWMKEEFNHKLDSIKFSRRKLDCLDLPPLLKYTISIDPSAHEAKLLKQLQGDLCGFLDSGEKITAASLMEQTIRLRQVCSAVHSTEVGENFVHESSKLKWLLAKLEEILPSTERTIDASAPKVIIWTTFRTTCIGIREVLESRYNSPVATIIGAQSEAERMKQVELFKKNDKCKILVATMSSGGIGLNLQEASYMIYFSKSYSQLEDTQSEARAYRMGSERHETIIRYDVVMKGTIEENIEKTLNAKKTIIQSIEEWRKTYGRDSHASNRRELSNAQGGDQLPQE